MSNPIENEAQLRAEVARLKEDGLKDKALFETVLNMLEVYQVEQNGVTVPAVDTALVILLAELAYSE